MLIEKARPYLAITATLFTLVAIFHLVRVINGWTFQFGPYQVPMWFSWLGTFFPAALAAWAIRLTRA